MLGLSYILGSRPAGFHDFPAKILLGSLGPSFLGISNGRFLLFLMTRSITAQSRLNQQCDAS